MDYQWIPISDKLIFNHLKNITPKGLTLLSLLLIETCTRYHCSISIHKLQTLVGFKDSRTVRKYLKILEKENLIKPIDNANFDTIPPRHLIDIDVLYKRDLEDEGYAIVPIDFFNYFIQHIDSIGWTLFCILIMHLDMKKGYAYISSEQMENILTIDRKTLERYLGILVKYRLLKVVRPEFNLELGFFSRKRYYLPQKIKKNP